MTKSISFEATFHGNILEKTYRIISIYGDVEFAIAVSNFEQLKCRKVSGENYIGNRSVHSCNTASRFAILYDSNRYERKVKDNYIKPLLSLLGRRIVDNPNQGPLFAPVLWMVTEHLFFWREMEHVVQAVMESRIFSMLRKANDLASMFSIMKQSVKEISEYHNISLLGNLYVYAFEFDC